MFAFWREDLKAAASLARLDMADLSESLSRRRRCRNSNEWAVWVRVYPPALLYWSHRCSFFCTPRPTMAFFTRPQSASAAVKIVAPTAVPCDSTKSSPKKGTFLRLSPIHLGHQSPLRLTDSTQRQCRNILIYG